jgi:hypothetical protein
MSDLFSDVPVDDSGSDSSSDTEEDDDSTIVTDSTTRTTLPQSDGNRSVGHYEDPNSSSEADDVDPRKLFQKPTLNELRYYYRENPYGKPVVRKPIQDAFKHGFDVENDNTERNTDGKGHIKDFLDEYKEYYETAEIKARRDGMSILMFHFGDDADTSAEPLGDGEFRGFKLWTVDNLNDTLADSTVADHTKYNQDQIYVSNGAENGGIALIDDISHPDHGKVVGYGIAPRSESEDVQNVAFVHASRCQPFLWGTDVDGPLGSALTGAQIGESVLTPVLQPLKAIQMEFWSHKEILYRYSAPLHAVEPPEDWGQEEWDQAEANMGDISMASDAILPPGSQLSVAEGSGEFDPEPIHNVQVKAVCSGSEMTKSVLEGTQTGTVSGSETDVKNYFNHVEKLRQNRMVSKFREAVQLVSQHDQETIPRVAGPNSFDIEWGPLFKASDAEMAEGMVSVITAVTNGIKNYTLTPNEARDIIEAKWSDFEADVDLDDLTEDEYDIFDRINMNEAGQGASDNDPGSTPRNNPRMKNGGGQEPGENRESSQPTRDGAVDLSNLSSEKLREELEGRET